MAKLKLRVVDPQVEHSRDIARRKVKAYKFPKQSRVNVHCPEGAPVLNVSEVLEKADIKHCLGKM